MNIFSLPLETKLLLLGAILALQQTLALSLTTKFELLLRP